VKQADLLPGQFISQGDGNIRKELGDDKLIQLLSEIQLPAL